MRVLQRNHEDEQQEEGPLPLPVLPHPRRLETEGSDQRIFGPRRGRRGPAGMGAPAAALADGRHGGLRPRQRERGPAALGQRRSDPLGLRDDRGPISERYFGPGSSITLARRHIPGLAVGEEQNVASFRVEEPPGDSVRVVVTGTRIVDEGNRGRIVTSLTTRTRVLSSRPRAGLRAGGARGVCYYPARGAAGRGFAACVRITRCALNPIRDGR